MSWQRTIQVKSRDPAFLWRMVIGIIGVGVILGWLVSQSESPSLKSLEGLNGNTAWDRLEALAADGDWWQVWWGVPGILVARYSQLGIVLLAVFSGICWFIFLGQFLRVRPPFDVKLGILLTAVALGLLSIWPTCFLILWQEYGWNLTESAELVPGLRFFILGVGLREEFSKLICLLPLMAVLVPRRDEMTALVASACVGLGFALEENIGYFLGSQGTAAVGRFLTANPAHMALTGLIGLNVYRAFVDPRSWGPQAVAMFGLMVFAHGLYDAFSLPDLAEYSLGGIIIFALVMYQFFHELRTLRSKGRDTVSLAATFLCAVSLLTAITFVYISAVAGSQVAADTLFADVFSLSVMVYLFLREMPETLVSV